MLDPGISAALPAQYRIALAVSLALLFHTLVLSALPLLFDRTEREASTLTFELVSTGSAPAKPSTASTTNQPPVPADVRNPDFEISPRETRPAGRPKAPKPTRPSQPDASPQVQPRPMAAAQLSPSPRPERDAMAAESAPMAAAAPTGIRDDTTPTDITRITRSPEETDAYIVQLASGIADKLERRRIRGIRDLAQPVTMEIELYLLESGALTRARVAHSSGMEDIDEAVYGATLAASPYPEIPEGDSRKRFRVELVFSPERITRP